MPLSMRLSELSKGKIPVTVVAGGSGSGKSRLIAQLRAARAPQQRWALLSNSGGPQTGEMTPGEVASAEPGPGAGVVLPDEVVAAGHYFRVAGGCACCVAGPAFRVTLVRLLRAGPWDHLHVEVDPTGHPHTLVDQLRSPPFDQYLTVTQLLLTLSEEESALYRAGAEPSAAVARGRLPAVAAAAAADRLAFATDFLLRTGPGDGPNSGPNPGPHADSTVPFAVWLESAPPWPRLERVAGRRLARADSGLPAELPGWRVFSALQPAQVPDDFDVFRQWPAETVAQRRPLKDALSALASDSGVTGFQALMRTPRAWYRWSFGRGRGTGSLTFNAGATLVEAETGWRFDNRICVWLRPGTRRPAIEARLQGLDRFLERSGGLLDPAIS